MGDTPLPSPPTRIEGLGKLAYNLWWSWRPEARELFRMLDIRQWRASGHNPIRMLSLTATGLLAQAAEDEEFLARYDAVMQEFESAMSSDDGWFCQRYGGSTPQLAYFSAEYGLHVSLPVYAGGLGILAGDYLKECSDMGVPVVAMGIIYAQGYVWQLIREDGWQTDVERTLDRTYDPISPVLAEDGSPLTVQVPLFDPPLYVRVWKVQVGRVPLYLMDTDVDGNSPFDRAITHTLYTSNPEQRLRQEIVLGIGGMRVLEALGIEHAALHINEGHPALAFLERIRSRVQAGASYKQATEGVHATSIFTTHTPVPAGTDVYPFALMEKYFESYYGELGLDREGFLGLGVNPQDPNAGFNMTVFALRMTEHSNAVSKRHGEVAREMWASMWPDRKVEDVPILSITNGVHLPSWIEPIHLQPLLDEHLDPNWREAQEQPEMWEAIDDIPDEVLWRTHQDLKALLTDQINERARERWQQGIAATNVIAFGSLLDSEILTVGFARRFAAYKRPDLILRDHQRLLQLLQDPWHPLQIVYAGKAHPADQEGKRLIQEIVRLAQSPELAGRIAFVENYDQQLAEYLVHGVDVWLNNPLPPLEASGTSGMKASINGVPNLSILDGWWPEGYDDSNGWAFGGEPIEGDRTDADSEAIYRLLQNEIIPMYYERSDDGIPHDFVKVMKAAIKSVAPHFSTRRMVKEYVERMYVKALELG